MKKIQRPKPGETDEDLIRQNQEFLKQLQFQDKNNEKRNAEGGDDEGLEKGRPTIEEILKKYNISVEAEDASVSSGSEVAHPAYEELGATMGNFAQKDHDFPFLEVKEKDPSDIPSVAPKASQPKKVSQFAKSRPRAEPVTPAVADEVTTTSASDGKQEPIGGRIHPLLEGMTEAEILEEQKKLIQKMDPKLVEFVRSMKHKRPPGTVTADRVPLSSLPLKQPREDEDINVSAEELPINPDQVREVPHMDKVESNKLLWTLPPKSKPANVKTESKPEERNARFDFQGKLLTEEEEKDSRTWLKGLHNHGEEMQRPGYTLDELLTLARSTNGGQRAAALDTFAEILRNAHDGMFDFMLGKSVFDLCLNMDWIYVVRKGIDHNDILTINAALNCLSGLLYSEREEMCLDTILIWSGLETGPCIVPEIEDNIDLMDKPQPRPNQNEEQNDDKDFQIAREDFIEFLLHRGCLLERFEYLLYSKSDYLTTFGLINMLKILIRIGRHSPGHLVKERRILDYFVEHHLQLNMNAVSDSKRTQKMEGVPSQLFLKLLRILISSSKANAAAVMQKYEAPIFSSIELNLSCSDTLLQVAPQIEVLIQQSILLWMSLASSGCGVERFFAFTPVTLKFFNLYLAKPLLNTFDLNHFALNVALLLKCLRTLHSSALEPQIRQYSHLIEQFVIRSCIILKAKHLEDQVDLDASLAALHQCLEFLIFARTATSYQSHCEAKLDQFLGTEAFERTTKRVIRASLLLCKPPKTTSNFDERYPKNLVFTEAVLFGGNLCPLLREGRFATVFLASLHNFARLANFQNTNLLVNKHIREYLEKLISARAYYNEENYYMKFELIYLKVVLETLDASELRTQLSYKLSPVPRIGKEELSKRILAIFLSAFNQQLSQEEITDIRNLYCQMIDLGSNPNNANEFGKWRSELLPSGWLTEPLKAVHSSLESLHATMHTTPSGEEKMVSESERQADEKKLKDAVLGFRIIVWRVLRFIQLCLSTTSLQSVLVQTKPQLVDFYTKICHVFLMSPTIFLYQPIRDNLQAIFRYFSNHRPLQTSVKSVVFTKSDESTNEMVGSAFESFYSQLVTEFSNTSYGDEVFSAYVLLPLRVQESKKIKLRFWTDVCVRFVRLEKENDLLPLSYFTGSQDRPAALERDPEILRVFESLLKRGTCTLERNAFLHDILTFYLTKQV